jgi:26S proteasome regulatory subunit T2
MIHQSVGTLEEFIDENHAIVSSSTGPESYAAIMSFVDKDQLEPGCSVLLNHRSYAVVGIMQDEVDPLLNVMKVEKAPLESYADIGGYFMNSNLDSRHRYRRSRRQLNYP